MKIAVNCWILRNKQIDGIGNFTIETLKPLIKEHPEIEFQILCDKNFTEDYFDFPNVTKHRIFPALRHPLLYVFYMEIVLGFFLRKHKPDLFLGMDGFLCLNTSTKQLPVIYDLNFEHYPQDLPFRNRIYFRTFFKRFAKKAERIATISEYSKEDIVKMYGIEHGKIDNVSCGIKDKFFPLSREKKEQIKTEYSAGEEYFFFVGSMHPRKNIIRLFQAFDIFKKQTQSRFKLILAGHILWDDNNIKAVLDSLEYKTDVIFTGRIADEQLNELLGSAYCLSFVPVFEGFGLPIVEAFQAGVPVICSNVTSMPEVAGDAALQVDPFNIDAIAWAMKTIYDNPALRELLIEKGHLQKAKFTWQKTAALMYESIIKAAT
ncbi:MAG: glycosyltransferase family 1 protein [Ferruginibacter sp.]